MEEYSAGINFEKSILGSNCGFAINVLIQLIIFIAAWLAEIRQIMITIIFIHTGIYFCEGNKYNIHAKGMVRIKPGAR
jgi:hypothetical protein